jgi:hypothetical protein
VNILYDVCHKALETLTADDLRLFAAQHLSAAQAFCKTFVMKAMLEREEAIA